MAYLLDHYDEQYLVQLYHKSSDLWHRLCGGAASERWHRLCGGPAFERRDALKPDFFSRHEDVEPTSRWYDLINELQELVQEIRVAEKCLGALGKEENDEMAEMQAPLRKDFGHTG